MSLHLHLGLNMNQDLIVHEYTCNWKSEQGYLIVYILYVKSTVGLYSAAPYLDVIIIKGLLLLFNAEVYMNFHIHNIYPEGIFSSKGEFSF